MIFKTTTPKGTEGFNLSYSDEERCFKKLPKLSDDWTAEFSWIQILFDADVKYGIDKETKTIHIVYNQNLHIWDRDVASDIEKGLINLGVLKEKAPVS